MVNPKDKAGNTEEEEEDDEEEEEEERQVRNHTEEIILFKYFITGMQKYVCMCAYIHQYVLCVTQGLTSSQKDMPQDAVLTAR